MRGEFALREELYHLFLCSGSDCLEVENWKAKASYAIIDTRSPIVIVHKLR